MNQSIKELNVPISFENQKRTVGICDKIPGSGLSNVYFW